MTMPPDEPTGLRRRSDQEQLARYELMEEITRAVNAGVDKAMKAVHDHQASPHPHEDTPLAATVRTLWDERNQLKGWIAAFALGGAVLGGIIGAMLPLLFHK